MITLNISLTYSPGSITILVNNTYLFSGDSFRKYKEIITKFLEGDKNRYKIQVTPRWKRLYPD